MTKKSGSTTRPKTVVRSAKTGRFVKASTAKRSPSTTIVEQVEVKTGAVEVARSASTGRFVKKDTARRHPTKTTIQKVKR